MEVKAAKELLHILAWLDRVDEIVRRGKESYLTDDLLQEAGDSLMMKLGEAANRLSRLDVLAPDGVEWALAVANRNFIIRRDQPRAHLADAFKRSADVEGVSPRSLRRGRGGARRNRMRPGCARGAEIRVVSRLGMR